MLSSKIVTIQKHRRIMDLQSLAVDIHVQVFFHGCKVWVDQNIMQSIAEIYKSITRNERKKSAVQLSTTILFTTIFYS